MYVIGWAVLLFRSLGVWRKPGELLERLHAVPVWKFLLTSAIGSAVIFVLVQPAVIGTLLVGDPDWNLPARLLLAQARSYGILLWIALGIGLLLASRWDLAARGAGLLTIMITMCGVILLALSEIERSWRFWWFWPLQCIAVAAVLAAVLHAWKPPRWVSAGLIILTMAAFFPYRLIASEAEGILTYGYGGPESGQVEAMEWLAAAADGDPQRLFAIGVMRYQGESNPTLAWGWRSWMRR